MQTRILGWTGLELSVIGLGTWAIGGTGWAYGWGSQSDEDSVRAILEGFSEGINWIDTAAAYGIGHSEEVVGRALKQWGKPVIIATKCGLIPDRQGGINTCLKSQSIVRECEASLKRLAVEIIDIYQIHWPNPSGDIEEAFKTLLELQKHGKIRYASVSNFSVKQMTRVEAFGKIASLQPPYSMVNRGIETEILPFCNEHKIGVLAYSPLQCGLLTGKVTRERVDALPQDDWRKTKSEYFQEPRLSKALNLVEKLRLWGGERGMSVAETALAWVLRKKEVTSAIAGIRKPGQIKELAKAGDIRLTGEDMNELEALVPEYL